MMRLMFLVTLLVAYSFGHGHHDDDDDDDHHHHHEGSVDLSLDTDNGKLTVLFHAPPNENFSSVKISFNGGSPGIQSFGVTHGNHKDWSYVFDDASGINVCDHVDVLVKGVIDGVEREEFHGSVQVPGANC